MNKDEGKTYQEIIRKEIREEFVIEMRKRLVELGIKENDLRKLMKIKNDMWRKMLSDINKNIPIEIVCKLSVGLEDEHNQLLKLWIKLSDYRTNKPIQEFTLLKKEQLLWIINNGKKLLDINAKYLLFISYLCELNNKGQQRLKEEINYMHKALQMEKRNKIIYKWDFISEEEYHYKTVLRCLKQIEEWDEFWEIGGIDSRKFLIHIWSKIYELTIVEKEIIYLFDQYGNPKSAEMSNEQIVCITLAILFAKDEAYIAKS